jgi:hypothetical protein
MVDFLFLKYKCWIQPTSSYIFPEALGESINFLVLRILDCYGLAEEFCWLRLPPVMWRFLRREQTFHIKKSPTDVIK